MRRRLKQPVSGSGTAIARPARTARVPRTHRETARLSEDIQDIERLMGGLKLRAKRKFLATDSWNSEMVRELMAEMDALEEEELGGLDLEASLDELEKGSPALSKMRERINRAMWFMDNIRYYVAEKRKGSVIPGFMKTHISMTKRMEDNAKLRAYRDNLPVAENDLEVTARALARAREILDEAENSMTDDDSELELAREQLENAAEEHASAANDLEALTLEREIRELRRRITDAGSKVIVLVGRRNADAVELIAAADRHARKAESYISGMFGEVVREKKIAQARERVDAALEFIERAEDAVRLVTVLRCIESARARLAKLNADSPDLAEARAALSSAERYYATAAAVAALERAEDKVVDRERALGGVPEQYKAELTRQRDAAYEAQKRSRARLLELASVADVSGLPAPERIAHTRQMNRARERKNIDVETFDRIQYIREGVVRRPAPRLSAEQRAAIETGIAEARAERDALLARAPQARGDELDKAQRRVATAIQHLDRIGAPAPAVDHAARSLMERFKDRDDAARAYLRHVVSMWRSGDAMEEWDERDVGMSPSWFGPEDSGGGVTARIVASAERKLEKMARKREKLNREITDIRERIVDAQRARRARRAAGEEDHEERARVARMEGEIEDLIAAARAAHQTERAVRKYIGYIADIKDVDASKHALLRMVRDNDLDPIMIDARPDGMEPFEYEKILINRGRLDPQERLFRIAHGKDAFFRKRKPVVEDDDDDDDDDELMGVPPSVASGLKPPRGQGILESEDESSRESSRGSRKNPLRNRPRNRPRNRLRNPQGSRASDREEPDGMEGLMSDDESVHNDPEEFPTESDDKFMRDRLPVRNGENVLDEDGKVILITRMYGETDHEFRTRDKYFKNVLAKAQEEFNKSDSFDLALQNAGAHYAVCRDIILTYANIVGISTGQLRDGDPIDLPRLIGPMINFNSDSPTWPFRDVFERSEDGELTFTGREEKEISWVDKWKLQKNLGGKGIPVYHAPFSDMSGIDAFREAVHRATDQAVDLADIDPVTAASLRRNGALNDPRYSRLGMIMIRPSAVSAAELEQLVKDRKGRDIADMVNVHIRNYSTDERDEARLTKTRKTVKGILAGIYNPGRIAKNRRDARTAREQARRRQFEEYNAARAARPAQARRQPGPSKFKSLANAPGNRHLRPNVRPDVRPDARPEATEESIRQESQRRLDGMLTARKAEDVAAGVDAHTMSPIDIKKENGLSEDSRNIFSRPPYRDNHYAYVNSSFEMIEHRLHNVTKTQNYRAAQQPFRRIFDTDCNLVYVKVVPVNLEKDGRVVRTAYLRKFVVFEDFLNAWKETFVTRLANRKIDIHTRVALAGKVADIMRHFESRGDPALAANPGYFHNDTAALNNVKRVLRDSGRFPNIGGAPVRAGEEPWDFPETIKNWTDLSKSIQAEALATQFVESKASEKNSLLIRANTRLGPAYPEFEYRVRREETRLRRRAREISRALRTALGAERHRMVQAAVKEFGRSLPYLSVELNGGDEALAAGMENVTIG